jgi:hypothetical protein
MVTAFELQVASRYRADDLRQLDWFAKCGPNGLEVLGAKSIEIERLAAKVCFRRWQGYGFRDTSHGPGKKTVQPRCHQPLRNWPESSVEHTGLAYQCR